MRKVDGTEKVNLSVQTNRVGSLIEDTLTLNELGWDGEQGEELEKFMQEAYEAWIWENIEGHLDFQDEE